MLIKHYFTLLRLRTLPLAWAVIIAGNALVWHEPTWRASLFVMSLLTALLLQMLSNVANDYGDGLRGGDRFRSSDAPLRLSHQLSDKRPVQTFLLMLVLLSVISGLILLWLAPLAWQNKLLFVLLGSGAVLAALTYTLGRRPYGYYGFGEVSVLVFFGWLGVMGSAYLQVQQWQSIWLLPATVCGVLCASVLHINNIRDLDADAQAGKRTLAGYLGFSGSLKMWCVMQGVAVIGVLLYAHQQGWQHVLSLLILPFWWRYFSAMYTAQSSQQVGQQLGAAVWLVLCWQLAFAVAHLIMGVPN